MLITETNKTILKMIKDNYSTDRICKELSITKKELKGRIESIKYYGYNIKEGYKAIGNQGYYLEYNPYNSSDNFVKIDDILASQLKTIVIGDTHIGNPKANLKYIEMIYDYCVQNSIHIVFHAGDLIEGNYGVGLSVEKQLEYLINNYPKDSNILTFIAPGNHDESFTKETGIKLKTVIENYRDDLKILGYGESRIKLSEDEIAICHRNRFTNSYGLRIMGHSHVFKFRANNQTPLLIVPSLSDLAYGGDYPGAIELSLNFDNNIIRSFSIKHIIIDENEELRGISPIEMILQKRK